MISINPSEISVTFGYGDIGMGAVSSKDPSRKARGMVMEQVLPGKVGRDVTDIDFPEVRMTPRYFLMFENIESLEKIAKALKTRVKELFNFDQKEFHVLAECDPEVYNLWILLKGKKARDVKKLYEIAKIIT